MGLFFSGAFAFDAANVPKKKQTTIGLYLDAKEAYGMAEREKILFLDVRTRAEVNFLGMPTIADANVPYMEMDAMYSWNEKKGVFKLESNSDFVAEVEKRLKAKEMNKSDSIILICRSGKRSAKAANLLAKAGYGKVYSVVDGYEGDMAKSGENAGRRAINGWKNADLPWSYKLDKDKMYFN